MIYVTKDTYVYTMRKISTLFDVIIQYKLCFMISMNFFGLLLISLLLRYKSNYITKITYFWHPWKQLRKIYYRIVRYDESKLFLSKLTNLAAVHFISSALFLKYNSVHSKDIATEYNKVQVLLHTKFHNPMTSE